MLLRGGGRGAPGNRCAAIAEPAAVPCPIEHSGEPTAIAAIILARLPLLRDGHAECGKGADGSGRRRLRTAPFRLRPFFFNCRTQNMENGESIHRDCSANNRDTLCEGEESWSLRLTGQGNCVCRRCQTPEVMWAVLGCSWFVLRHLISGAIPWRLPHLGDCYV